MCYDPYEELFIAIWANAVDDDIQKAVNSLADYAFNIAYEDYSLKSVKPLNKDSKQIKEIKKEIHDISKEAIKVLIPKIKESVYRESQEWPNNKRVYNDPDYDLIFKRLKKDVLGFAQNKIQELLKPEEKN